MVKCTICDGEIKPSGFNGNLFCWGKCYHYLSDQEIKVQTAHKGDPCIYCGTPHDEVEIGPCPERVKFT